ncbi:MAG: DUF2177 family protein [Pseudomonadota bacterium]
MQIAILYVTSMAFFLVVDAIVLNAFMKQLFMRHVASLMRSPFDMAPAAVFYLFYVAGVIWLISWPALQNESIFQAALGGTLLGALAYGTYEFTNKATLKGWQWSMVAIDTTWGALLTGSTAAFGVWATLLLA